jgi:hypothetical protein
VILDVYIIRHNTPESRLLSQLGFSRDSLPVAEWRGRRRSKGGYGRSPVAWRISGKADVEKLCMGIVHILGSKPAQQRTLQEQAALERAERALVAFSNRARHAAAAEQATESSGPPLLALLRRLLPSALDPDLASVMEAVERSSPRTVDELRSLANEALTGRPSVWTQARAEFVSSMESLFGRSKLEVGK